MQPLKICRPGPGPGPRGSVRKYGPAFTIHQAVRNSPWIHSLLHLAHNRRYRYGYNRDIPHPSFPIPTRFEHNRSNTCPTLLHVWTIIFLPGSCIYEYNIYSYTFNKLLYYFV